MHPKGGNLGLDSGRDFLGNRVNERVIIAGRQGTGGDPYDTVDPASTPEETACQLILKCYWSGYISGVEPAIAESVMAAYPHAVERVRRHADAPTAASAAAALLE